MSSKHCPHCNCNTETIRFGTTSSGRHRYRCKCCSRTWTSRCRPKRLADNIWRDFAWNNLPVRELARKYHKHPNTIRKLINDCQPEPINLSNWTDKEKESVRVIIMDTTYFGRKHGVVTVLDAYDGKLLYFKEIDGSETNRDYIDAIESLMAIGIRPKACVIDGRKGVAEALEYRGILVQLCQFHMRLMVRRYLTMNPILQPNIELKNIVDCIGGKHGQVGGDLFLAMLYGWKNRYGKWLRERTRNEFGELEYTHRETRKAFFSLANHYQWLFTYEKYPELKIPRTSNRIEGKFGNAKDKLRLHHGYTRKLKIKILFSLLSGE